MLRLKSLFDPRSDSLAGCKDLYTLLCHRSGWFRRDRKLREVFPFYARLNQWADSLGIGDDDFIEGFNKRHPECSLPLLEAETLR